MPTIEWHKHQEPETWARLLAEAGLEVRAIRWFYPYRVATWCLGPLVENRVAARVLHSYFILHARRPAR